MPWSGEAIHCNHLSTKSRGVQRLQALLWGDFVTGASTWPLIYRQACTTPPPTVRFTRAVACADPQQNDVHAARAHLHASKDRQRQREGGEAAGYLQDVGSGRSQMRRPDCSTSMNWR